MKKMISVILVIALIMVTVLCSCGKKENIKGMPLYTFLKERIDGFDLDKKEITHVQIELIGNGEHGMASVKEDVILKEITNAFKEIKLEKKTDEVMTDSYNYFDFTLDDGKSYCISFNYKNLELKNEKGEYEYYTVTDNNTFWAIANKLALEDIEE